eukprot:TRINITY_DN18899_c0_g1_i1.p1 TRINITY_DN18899_c0_g1~~TRINITY_DN18899_c0_g1_i1.p1  ORF type:complete len:158 (+),score=41.31 TRINITY_DN18899_c0_g1_i1:135-608(+)
MLRSLVGSEMCIRDSPLPKKMSTRASDFATTNSHNRTLVDPKPSETYAKQDPLIQYPLAAPSDRYKYARNPAEEIRKAIQGTCMQCGESVHLLWRRRICSDAAGAVSYNEFCDKVKVLGSGIQLTPGDVAVALVSLSEDEDGNGRVTLEQFQKLMED